MANRYLHNVQGLFDTIAPNYDRMNNIISLGTHRHWRKQKRSEDNFFHCEVIILRLLF